MTINFIRLPQFEEKAQIPDGEKFKKFSRFFNIYSNQICGWDYRKSIQKVSQISSGHHKDL